MRKLFTDHPRSVGESYAEHFAFAAGVGRLMLAGGLACLVHAIAPFLFMRTGSRCLAEIQARMEAKRPFGATNHTSTMLGGQCRKS
jgi:hypothetical protein